jgi:hypothetical protein
LADERSETVPAENERPHSLNRESVSAVNGHVEQQRERFAFRTGRPQKRKADMMDSQTASATVRARASQHDFGFAHSDEQSSPSRARAKRREADWRRQLARALQYALGKSPELVEELIAEYECREQEGPEFMRQRPVSSITEAPLVNLDRNERIRLVTKFRTLCRRSWEAKAPGKHRGAITRAMESTFLALMYLAEKYGRVYPSLVGLGHLAMCCKDSVVDALAELEKLGFVTHIRRLREVNTALGFKTVQDTNAYLVHEPTSGLGLLAIRMFYAESGYPAASEAYSSNLKNDERYERWLDADSPLGQALTRLGALVMRQREPIGAR